MNRILLSFIRFYQCFISPLTGPHCRFYPTCSEYAADAIKEHGAGSGSWLALKRVCRCHPFCEGGCDPVPSKKRLSEQANIS